MKKQTHSESEIVKSVNGLEAECLQMKSAGDSMFPEPRSINGNGSTAVSQVPRTLLNVIDDSDRVAVAQHHLGERQTEQRSLRQRPMNSFRMNFKIGAMETESKF